MANRRYSPKRSARSARGIVRRAGPQKRWNFVDYTSQSTSGVGSAYYTMPLLLASDYEDNQVQQKERVIVDVVQLRARHYMTGPLIGNPQALLSQFFLWTADLETAADVLTNTLSPWGNTAAQWEEADTQLIRSWGYAMNCNQLTANEGEFNSISHRVWMKSFRIKLRMKEPVGLYLGLNTLGIGTGQASTLEFAYRIKMRSW